MKKLLTLSNDIIIYSQEFFIRLNEIRSITFYYIVKETNILDICLDYIY